MATADRTPADDAAGRAGVVDHADLPPRRAFSVDEFHRLVDAGVLGPAERVELIEGDLAVMSPIGSRHVRIVARLDAILQAGLAGRALVFVQSPVRLDARNEPQPDLVLLRPRADDDMDALPEAADVPTLIEVMDSSARHDRGPKLQLYARAGVPEVWLVDLTRDRLEIHRAPEAGRYSEAREGGPGESAAPATLPDLAVAHATVFGR